MRKKGLVVFTVLALVACLSFTGTADAKKSKSFLLSKIKKGATTLKLAKPSGGVIEKDIKQTAGTRPTFKMYYSKLDQKGSNNYGVSVDMSFQSQSDPREITISGVVKVKRNKSGSKILSIAPVGEFSFAGVDSEGLIVTGTFAVAEDAFTKSKKRIDISSFDLLKNLTTDEELGGIGAIGTEAGVYTYTFGFSGMPTKYRSRTFNTLTGILNVEAVLE